MDHASSHDRVAPPPSIPERMSVADVRRHLNEIRKMWRGHSPHTPFYASAPLQTTPRVLSVSEFAFGFVQSKCSRGKG